MNIEKTISEHAVSDILTPMLESQDRIVTEDVAPLFDQATGLDTPPASGTVTTTIEESRSVITAIIRKAWTATLTMLGGASVLSYIAAAYTYLQNRLQGNETYGIPDRRSEISASSPLAANLALLNDRKISGVIGAPDGISFAQLVGSSDAAASVTEITDDNTGWTANKVGWLSSLLNSFPNATKFIVGCSSITAAPTNANSSVEAEVHIKSKDLAFSPDNQSLGNIDLWLDEVETCNVRAQGPPMFRAKRIFFPIFKNGTYSIGGSAGWTNGTTQYIYFGCYGKRTESIILTNAAGGSTGSAQALAILEVRQGARQRIEFANIPSWDCYPNMTAANIVAYIFDKLADNNYEDDGVTEAPAITIKLGSYLLAKLSAEQIAVATNKNYTVTA